MPEQAFTMRLLVAPSEGRDRLGRTWDLDEMEEQLREYMGRSGIVTTGFDPARPIGRLRSVDRDATGLYATVEADRPLPPEGHVLSVGGIQESAGFTLLEVTALGREQGPF